MTNLLKYKLSLPFKTFVTSVVMLDRMSLVKNFIFKLAFMKASDLLLFSMKLVR